MKDSLGDRMKEKYEHVFRAQLPGRMPVIIRVDGKAFHTYTRGLNKPFDDNFIRVMNETAMYLCKNIQGAVMAYVQSDEISILVINYQKFETSSWFNNEVQKMASVAAGMASAHFTSLAPALLRKSQPAVFDGRCFILPKEEVCNYFVWRQKDWERNSIQMLTRHHYSQKQMNGKKCSDMHDMLHEKGVNWNDVPTYLKRGRTIIKRVFDFHEWIIDAGIPQFILDRDYIEKLVYIEEESKDEN